MSSVSNHPERLLLALDESLKAFSQMKPMALDELRDAFERAKPVVLNLARKYSTI